MRLFYDVDLQRFILGPNTTQELPSISVKRSPNTPIQIQFFHSGNPTPIELASGATGVFEVKETGKYDADAVTAALSWVKSGSGVTTLYTLVLDLMNEALDALLGVNDPVTCTSTFGTDVINATAHGLLAGQIVQFQTTDTLPAPLEPNTDYFVINPAANTFQVSLTNGGAAINLTNDGTGTHKFRRTDNDVVSINLMAALQYVESGNTNESQTLVFTLVNDVCRDEDTSVPPTPEDVVLNVRAGKEGIANGTDTGSVVFDTPFAGGANVCVVVSIAKPAAGDNIFATVKEDTVDETGFDYDLSAEVPATGYLLNYMAVAV